MKTTTVLLLSFICFSIPSFALSEFDGIWTSEDGQHSTRMTEFDGKLTMQTQGYYDNGARTDYFFQFQLPRNSRAVEPGQILQGRLRSLDGYYGCVFDEKAQAMIDEQGRLRIHHPLLTYYRETRSVVDRRGYRYHRRIDWNGWRWVEHVYSYPVEQWRVISSECVITQRNWVTAVLIKENSGPLPLPQPERAP